MINIQNPAVESVLFSCVFCNAFDGRVSGEADISRAHFGIVFLGWYRQPRYPAPTVMHGSFWVVKMATMVLLGTETGYHGNAQYFLDVNLATLLPIGTRTGYLGKYAVILWMTLVFIGTGTGRNYCIGHLIFVLL